MIQIFERSQVIENNVIENFDGQNFEGYQTSGKSVRNRWNGETSIHNRILHCGN